MAKFVSEVPDSYSWGLADEDVQIVKSVVLAKDFRWWVDKTKVADAKKQVIEQTGIKISVRDFKKLREECEWFGKAKRRITSKVMLDAKEWERLQFEVLNWGEFLADKTIEEAALIISTELPCNPGQLMGLTKKFHLWKKAGFVVN